MPEWLQLFAVARYGRPVILFALIYSILWLIIRALRVDRQPGPGVTRLVRAILLATAIVATVAFVGIAVWYAGDPRYYDFAEATMPSVAWMFERGKALYPSLDAPERYAHIYGPMAFIPLAAAMRVFGPTLAATKWMGAGAGILALAVLFSMLKARVGSALAVIFTGGCALLLLIFRNAAFWVRPDSLELLCSAIGLWAALRRSRGSWLTLGISAGVLWNLKFSGPLYSLPIFVIFFERADRQRLVLALSVALLIACLPFLVFESVSFTNYCRWILASSRSGIVWATLRQNLEWLVFFSAPLVAAVLIGARQQPVTVLSRAAAISLAIASCAIAVLASKPGAGPYHLLPLLPLFSFLTAVQTHQLRGDNVRVLFATLAFAGVAVLIASAQQTSFLSTVRQLDAAGPIADVTRFMGNHPGAVIQMGYSSDERMTFVRPLVVFQSGMYLLDQPAIQEHQLAGMEIPRATDDLLRSCAVTYWLIPKTGEPFSGTNRYPAMHGRALFGRDFRQAFFDSYRRSDSTEYFDVWSCRLPR